MIQLVGTIEGTRAELDRTLSLALWHAGFEAAKAQGAAMMEAQPDLGDEASLTRRREASKLRAMQPAGRSDDALPAPPGSGEVREADPHPAVVEALERVPPLRDNGRDDGTQGRA